MLALLLGALLGWLRMRSATVWPCAVAHGAFNASQAAILLVLVTHPSTGLNTPLIGWTGWSVLAAAVVLLAATRQYRWSPTTPPSGARTPSSSHRADLRREVGSHETVPTVESTGAEPHDDRPS